MTLPKGPWTVSLFVPDPGYAKIRDDRGNDLAGVSCYRTDVRVDELARAICALPALIEAARALLAELGTMEGLVAYSDDDMFDGLKAALRIVDGE